MARNGKHVADKCAALSDAVNDVKSGYEVVGLK